MRRATAAAGMLPGLEPEDPIAALRRWEEHGATWRLVDAGPAGAVVELCTCAGEPIDVLRSDDAAFVALVTGRAPVSRLAGRSLDELLEAFAAPRAVPGGGSAVALAAALAAGLLERCATAGTTDAGPRARRARRLRDELAVLADEDAAALAHLVRTRETGSASGPPARLRALALEVADLAAALEADGAPRLRGEAACARLLAGAAAEAAAAILAVNDPGPDRPA